METYDLFLSLGVATAAGLLIGLERESSAPRDGSLESFLGGSRTHPLLALVGALAALLTRQLGAGVLVVSLAGIMAFLIASYVDDIRRGADRGLTSEAAFLASFLLGALALSRGVVEPVSRRIFVVAATAVVATLLLSAKPALHPFARRVSREDVTATLKFLIVALVVLPLLPNQEMGPLQALNPRHIGLMVLLSAGVSFLGYAAIRLLGPRRGLGLTGLIGGLASSTAVTLSLSSQARAKPRMEVPLAVGVLLASTIMFVRVLVIIAAVNPALIAPVALPLLTMLFVGLAVSLVLYRRARAAEGEASEVPLPNPFELRKALEFGLVFSLVLLGSKAATLHLGTGGTYAAGAVAGIADVDAITLSMAKLAPGEIPARVAGSAILIGVGTNTVTKGVLAAALGGWGFARRLVPAFAVILAAGAIALWVTLT